MNTLLGASLQQQTAILMYGRGTRKDLDELAALLREKAPGCIADAKHQLTIDGQCAEYYYYWRGVIPKWEKALRLSTPEQNLYLTQPPATTPDPDASVEPAIKTDERPLWSFQYDEGDPRAPQAYTQAGADDFAPL